MTGLGVTPATTRGRASSRERELIACAAALFNRHGYAQTTTRQIAEEMGLQKGSVYHYFSRKEDLLLRICRESLKSISDAVVTASEGDGPTEDEQQPLDALKRAIRAHVMSVLRDQEMHAAMLAELRSLSPGSRGEIIALRSRHEALWEGLIAKAVNAGDIRSDIDIRYLRLALLGLLNWTIVWYRPEGALRPVEWSDLITELFLDGALSKDMPEFAPTPGSSCVAPETPC